jgi:nucleotide-binding universal stress UspA family protein
MYRSILVPLDGSHFAEHALPFALTIARRRSARLQLITVHRDFGATYGDLYSGESNQYDRLLRHRDRSYLDALEKRLQGVATVPVSTILADGPVVETLAEQGTGADLVVMTTHGRGALSRAWLGSVADDLVRRLAKPILLIRPRETDVDLTHEPPLRKVLIPLDGSALAEQIIEPAIALDGLDKTAFALLRSVTPAVLGPDPPDEVSASGFEPILLQLRTLHEDDKVKAQSYLDGVADRMRARSLQVQTRLVVNAEPVTAILNEIKNQSADLIALATHGRSGLVRLYMGSVADKIVRGAPIPVLVYRPVQR